MNKISLANAFVELGANGKEEVTTLSTFLSSSLVDENRFAPSLMTRSEALLFGISMPRFAVRLFLNGQRGFINARRLSTFIDHVEIDNDKEWGVRRKNLPEEARNRAITTQGENRPLREILSKRHQSCVADSFFETPNYLTPAQFEILRTKLAKCYGEVRSDDQKQDFWGLPYVKNIDLGEGLCMQSVCYMATAILHRYAKGIYGLAEITALAHDPKCQELRLSGMSTENLRLYFDHVGLRCNHEKPCPNFDGFKLAVPTEAEFITGIKGYLNSGMPVIFPTDMGPLLGVDKDGNELPFSGDDSIYGRNQFKFRAENFDPSISHGHAMLIVGYSIDKKGEEPLFVLHDPFWMPYMLATAPQLGASGGYLDNGLREQDSWAIMPVTPRAVKMPLLWGREATESPYQRGLLWISKHIRALPESDYPHLPAGEKSSSFLLVQIKDIHGTKPLQNVHKDFKADFGTRLKECQAEMRVRFSWKDTHWVWLETTESSIWVWDAEVRPNVALDNQSNSTELGELLRVIIHRERQQTLTKWYSVEKGKE